MFVGSHKNHILNVTRKITYTDCKFSFNISQYKFLILTKFWQEEYISKKVFEAHRSGSLFAKVKEKKSIKYDF